MARIIKLSLLLLVCQIGFSQTTYLFKDRVKDAVEEKFQEISSTGLIYLNGNIAINSVDNTKFNVPAGYGVIVDNTVMPIKRNYVEWNAFTAQTTPYLASATNTFIAIKLVGTTPTLELTQDLQGAAERSDVIVIGWLEHLAGTHIEKVGTEPDYNVNTAIQFQQYLESIGAFNIEGNDIFPNGSNLKLNISAGTIFDNGLGYSQDKRRPNHYITNAITQVPMKYTYKNGAGDWFNALSNTTNIDPAHYDDGTGILQNIPSGKWSIQRVYYYAPFGYLDIYYDQKYYNSKEEALSGFLVDQIDENPYLSYDIPLAIIIVKADATDLSDITHCEIRSVNDKSIGGGGGTGGGEANTASNIGTLGAGVFKQKLGVDLEFKNIAAANSTIIVEEDLNDNITIKTNLDGVYQKIITVPSSNLLPAANTVPAGTLANVTDNNRMYRNNGIIWLGL